MKRTKPIKNKRQQGIALIFVLLILVVVYIIINWLDITSIFAIEKLCSSSCFRKTSLTDLSSFKVLLWNFINASLTH